MLSLAARKFQPIGFPGRRATIRAPTVEKANIRLAWGNTAPIRGTPRSTAEG